jgi:hypothetical protein
MGLADKRAQAVWQEKEFPTWKTKIDSVTGFDVPFDVKWETLLEDGRADLMNEGYTKVYFQPLLDALTSICSDQMGKTALKGALKKVLIDGSKGSDPSDLSFKDGALVLQHKPFSNMDDVKGRTKKLTSLLEGAL